MDMILRPATPTERLYAYEQSMQIGKSIVIEMKKYTVQPASGLLSPYQLRLQNLQYILLANLSYNSLLTVREDIKNV